MSTMTYHAPESAEEAVGLVAEDPEGTVVLGGGTFAVPALRRSPRVVRQVVDLRRAGLGTVTVTEDEVTVGATTSYSRLIATAELDEAAPILATMARGITGGASIRNQGTVGGALCHRMPNADSPGVFVALAAEAVVRTEAGEERVPLTEFLEPSYVDTHPPHLLEALRFPAVRSVRQGYRKLKFAQGTWPIVTAAVRIDPGDHGDTVTVVLGGIARPPVVVEVPLGTSVDQAGPDVVDTVRERVREDLAGREIWTDEFAPAGYRRVVAPRVAAGVLEEVLAP